MLDRDRAVLNVVGYQHLGQASRQFNEYSAASSLYLYYLGVNLDICHVVQEGYIVGYLSV